jgi:ABC-2 type transport system permease protein
VRYGAFIVPGLIMMSLMTQSVANASFGIYMPKFSGTVYDIMSAPISAVEIVLGYVGAAASKSVILGLLILATARLFVEFEVVHPIIGIWADGFDKVQIVPMLVITPRPFLGGSFYSLSMLPPFGQKVALFIPVVYVISGFRWSFFGVSDASAGC